MKLAQIVNRNFLEAVERLRSQKVSMKAAFTLAKVSKKIRQEVSDFEEARKSALERLCDKDEHGLPIMEGANFKLSNEALMKLAEELSDLTTMEVEIDKLKLSDLGDMSEIKMSTNDAELLEPLFEV
jgi:hypothetical protein